MQEVTRNGRVYVLFDLAIIPDHVFVDSPVCPHCDTPIQPELVEYTEGKNLLGDLMQCSDCEQLYLIVETPKLESIKQPIFTKWTVEDGYARFRK